MGLYAREYIEGRLNDASDLEWQDPSERFDPLNIHRVVFSIETIAAFCIADAHYKTKCRVVTLWNWKSYKRGIANANNTAADPQTEAAKN